MVNLTQEDQEDSENDSNVTIKIIQPQDLFCLVNPGLAKKGPWLNDEVRKLSGCQCLIVHKIYYSMPSSVSLSDVMSVYNIIIGDKHLYASLASNKR